MTELLHWAVENSDPAKLAELMRRYQEHNLTIKDVYGQEVIDALFRDEASDMMHLVALVADFRNASVPNEDLEAALLRLQEYIDQVDNAGNLHGMGGLAPLLDLSLESTRGTEVRALALWTLGVAAQNNPPVQADLLSLGGLRRLAARLPHCRGRASQPSSGRGASGAVSGPAQPEDGEEDSQFCGKLLFALSSLIRNNATTQTAADELGILGWLFREGLRHSSSAIVKKSLGLLDTVLAQSPELRVLDAMAPEQDQLAEALLAHARGAPGEALDADLADKAMRLVNRLLSLRPFLFGSDFGPRLAEAAAEVAQRCEDSLGMGDELCSGLAGLAAHANLMLTAGDVADEEL